MLDSLTLDQMRVLIAVAESGSFSAAARRLGRVQSAVSQARWQPAAVAHIDDVDLLDIAGIVGLQDRYKSSGLDVRSDVEQDRKSVV